MARSKTATEGKSAILAAAKSGMSARQGGCSRDECEHGPGPLRNAWLGGWEGQDKIEIQQNADESVVPDEEQPPSEAESSTVPDRQIIVRCRFNKPSAILATGDEGEDAIKMTLVVPLEDRAAVSE